MTTNKNAVDSIKERAAHTSCFLELAMLWQEALDLASTDPNNAGSLAEEVERLYDVACEEAAQECEDSWDETLSC